ncbi:hypothetical protein AaE_010716 [Aphanomyces astaci]|uniref:Tyr recombinase domain-containing protein n=1 Tax=Aphanomyces astaci TaxID=112090 RepID=A0A6A5A3U7_APHAT|nr:hypothetical protein AaE_010716 [Aphanomyces astaci]
MSQVASIILRASLPPNTAIKGMVGDVASAYRHLSASCTDAVWFGLAVPEAGVIGIDMSAPFGWCGSPNIYCAFGNGISWLVSRESPASLLPKMSSDHRPFWGFNYIDDHILIEQDIGYRLSCANNALRLAMMATLGPTSLNLQKFTPWSSTLTALGLTWDLSTGTVSMPLEKIAKAQLRVQSLLSGKLSTRHDLEKTLGSLRHVCSCIRPARAFYQCLHLTLRRFPRFGAHPLPPDAIADLSWFADILRVGHLSNVPTTILTGSSLPSFVLEMDASDEGLAVLFPTQRRFIRLEWDAVETALIQQCSNPRLEKMASANHKTDNSPQMASTQSQFSINVREHFCIALAIATWGPLLTDPLGLNTVHVETLTDNTSALAWSTSLVSSNSYSQELNRWLGLHQAIHQLHVLASTSRTIPHHMANRNSRLDRVLSGTRVPPDVSSISHFHRASLAPSSNERYSRVWKEWQSYQHSHGNSHWLPRDPVLQSSALFAFATTLWGSPTSRQNRATTILSKIAIISWHHRCSLNYTVRLSPAHLTQIRGMLRIRPPIHVKEPVSIALLLALRQRLRLHDSHDRVIWGSTVLAFFFLLRRSEYTAVDNKSTDHAIRLRDVSLLDKLGRASRNYDDIRVVQVYIRSSKTDQHSNGVALQLAKSGVAWLCPVAAAWVLIDNAQSIGASPNDPICCTSRGHAIKSDAISKCLKEAASAIGLEGSKYSTRSLRSGGATALFRGGASDLAIQLFGRWHSDAYKRYTRINGQEVAGMAARMVSSVL